MEKPFPDEVKLLHKGDRVQLIPAAGKDKNGKDKHNIVLLDSPATVSDSQANEPTDVAANEWSPERKRASATYVENQADLLGFCLKVSWEKFANVDHPLVETEESIRALAVSLYIATQRRFQM